MVIEIDNKDSHDLLNYSASIIIENHSDYFCHFSSQDNWNHEEKNNHILWRYLKTVNWFQIIRRCDIQGHKHYWDLAITKVNTKKSIQLVVLLSKSRLKYTNIIVNVITSLSLSFSLSRTHINTIHFTHIYTLVCYHTNQVLNEESAGHYITWRIQNVLWHKKKNTFIYFSCY